MGFLTRTRSALARQEPHLAAPVERRDSTAFTLSGDGWDAASAFGFGRHGAVNSNAAEGLAAVTTAVNAIAGGIAALPAAVYKSEGDGRVEASNHPVARLIRAPNARQTWPDWIEFTMSQVLLHGNAISIVSRDGAGRPTALHPVPWQCLAVQMLPSGRIAFDVLATGAFFGDPSLVGRWFETDVFFLKDRSDNGITGRSRLSRAPGVIRSALGLAEFSESVWENASRPSGMLTIPAGIKEEGLRRLRANWEQNQTGRQNAGKVLFAEVGQEFTPMSSTPEDSEVLESRKFGVYEVARLFNITPTPVAVIRVQHVHQCRSSLDMVGGEHPYAVGA